MKSLNIMRPACEDLALDIEPIEQLEVPDPEHLISESLQIQSERQADNELLVEAERTAEQLQVIGDSLISNTPIDLAGTTTALESLYETLGLSKDKVPAIDVRNLSVASEGLKETAKLVYDKIVAMVRKILESIKNLYERIRKLFTGVKAKAQHTQHKQAALKKTHSSNVLAVAQVNIDKKQEELGVFAEDLMVEVIENLDELLTKDLPEETEEKIPVGEVEEADATDQPVGESKPLHLRKPEITAQAIAIHSAILAKFFTAPSGKPSSVKEVTSGLMQLSEINTHLVSAVSGFIAESTKTFERYKSGQPNVGDLVSFSHHLQHDFISKVSANTHNLEIVKSGSFSKQLNEEVKSISFALQFPFYGAINFDYDGAIGSLTVTSSAYVAKSANAAYVQICPIDVQDHILAFLTRDTTQEDAKELKLVDDLRRLGDTLINLIADEGKAADKAIDGGQQELAEKYQQRVKQFRHCLHVMNGIQSLYAHYSTTRTIISTYLCDWVSKSIDALDRAANDSAGDSHKQSA